MYFYEIRRKMADDLCAFLPRHVGGRTIFIVYELLRKFSGFRRKNCENRRTENRAAGPLPQGEGRQITCYIEDQNSYVDMPFGECTLQSSGCGVIATCNLLLHLRPEAACSLSETAAAFEKDGMVLGGKWGVSPGAIRDYLESRGFRVRVAFRESQYETLAENSQGLILTMYNDRNDIRRQLHTIAITKEQGQYFAHNVYCDGRTAGPCASLTGLLESLHEGRAAGVILLAVSRPE